MSDEWLTDEEKAEQQAVYEKRYISKLSELGQQFDADESTDILQEMMSHHNVRHSENPASDAELNFLKAEKVYRQKNKFDSHADSLLDHIARSDGKSKKDVQKWAKENLKAPARASLGLGWRAER